MIADVEQRPGTLKRIEHLFAEHHPKLVFIHALMAIGFISLIVLPLFFDDPAENAGAMDHIATFANFVMWGLWFPLVFLSVVFTGRSWCGLLCPMGAASEWANSVGLQRPIPAWLRWPGMPVVSFIIVTLLGQTVGVRDHPEAIAEIFGGTLVLAICVGFVYAKNKRAWCRHACPIGLLLGVFSRLGAVQFQPKHQKQGKTLYTQKGICPTMIDISRKNESRHCIECFRCVKPRSKGGLFVRLRHPGEEVERIRQHNPNITEIVFLFLGTGLMLGGFLWLSSPWYQAWRMTLGEWFINHHQYWIGSSGPGWLMSVHPERREVFNWLDFITITSFMTACMMFFALILTITTALASRTSLIMQYDHVGFRQRFIELGYQYAPVALLSLIMGLGGDLFQQLPLTEPNIALTKQLLLITSLLWSLWLGHRILIAQGVKPLKQWAPLTFGFTGSVAIGAAWWAALF